MNLGDPWIEQDLQYNRYSGAGYQKEDDIQYNNVDWNETRYILLEFHLVGTWYDAWDQHRSNLVVRVGPKTGKGGFKKTFALVARFNGAKHPTRRALGGYPALSLEKARAKADRWNELIRKGIDPKAEEERERQTELRKQADTFNSVVEEFIKRVLPKQRRGQHVARELRREFVERWKGRPITSITRRDVTGIDEIEYVLRPAVVSSAIGQYDRKADYKRQPGYQSYLCLPCHCGDSPGRAGRASLSCRAVDSYLGYYNRVATRSLALLARGFDFRSSLSATTGFFVTIS